MKKSWKESQQMSQKRLLNWEELKRGQLKKEGLITSILKSKSSNAERNYMKHFSTNINNNNVDNNANDDTYDDDKIRDKISDIRVMLSRLGDIVTKDDRVKIRKEIYEIIYLSDKDKEKIDDNLLELKNKLNKKEKYKYDCDDLHYHGISDTENLFNADNNED